MVDVLIFDLINKTKIVVGGTDEHRSPFGASFELCVFINFQKYQIYSVLFSDMNISFCI